MNKMNSPSQGKAGKVILIWIGRVSPLFKSTDICKTPNCKIFSGNANFRTACYSYPAENQYSTNNTHITIDAFSVGA